MHSPIRRLNLDFCAAIIIDVQEFFLKDVAPEERQRLIKTFASFAEICTHLHLPTLCTIEKPIVMKGSLPEEIKSRLPTSALILEKNFFDLTAEADISETISSLNKRQLVICGSETDVCVLQSCLGLIGKGYEVFVVEDLLFSSSLQVESAKRRMREAGATFLTYKTLYYELLRAVAESPHRASLTKRFGKIPEPSFN